LGFDDFEAVKAKAQALRVAASIGMSDREAEDRAKLERINAANAASFFHNAKDEWTALARRGHVLCQAQARAEAEAEAEAEVGAEARVLAIQLNQRRRR
jgi:hypothetical protein